MPDIVTGKIFVDGEKGITATKLNQIQSLAVIQPSFYTTKASSPTLDPTDTLLELKATGSYAQITGSQLISSLATSMQPAVNAGLLPKSAAYTLLSSDSAKYVICSGGSWALTLPTPATGLNYRIRNDQGITGTTGTITLTPTSGPTIDGATTLPLLAGQECWLLTDGVNWRTFGRQRTVVVGSRTITAVTANDWFLLPPGYSYYELNWDPIIGDTSAGILTMNFSSDGGTTWRVDSNYGVGIVYTATATTAAYAYQIGTSATLTYGSPYATTPNIASQCFCKLWPGQNVSAPLTNRYPHWKCESWGFNGTLGVYECYINGGHYVGAGTFLVNAVRYQMSPGNIFQTQLTVKGVV